MEKKDGGSSRISSFAIEDLYAFYIDRTKGNLH